MDYEGYYEILVNIVIPETIFFIQAIWEVLTDYRNYGTMDQDVIYFLSGCLFVIIVSTIGYFKVLNKFPEKGSRVWK